MSNPRFTVARFNVAALVASSMLFSAGCGNMQTTATDPVVSGAATFTGRVHGGNQPVSNEAVQLYAVGGANAPTGTPTGPGQNATLFAQTITANNGTGSFTFIKNPGNSGPSSNPSSTNAYSCPTGTDPLMYIYSAGGNTTGNGTGTQNTSAAFLAPVGRCSQISNSTFVDVSEVSTAATVAALAQFINPNTDQIGADSIGVAYQAMINAFATIPNLVSAANGLANATTTIAGAGTGVAGVTMNVTAPAAQLNTIANIISACVNQASANSGTNCSTLFANAVPPASSATESQPNLTYYPANDTIKAALYMYLNPTNGMSSTARTNLFNLQAAAGAPYQPSLSSAPGNWLLAMTYGTANTCGSQNSTFFSHPYDLNIDINGNVWIANKAGSNGAVVEISPGGTPETCVSLGGSSMGGGVVDTNGSIWYGDNTDGIVYAYNPSGGAVRSFTAPGVVGVTADGLGNIFFSTENSGTGKVYEILNASDVNNTSSPVLLYSGAGPNPARLFPDAANDIWVTSGSSFVTELVLTPTQANQHNYAANTYNVTGPTYGIMVGPNNRVYVTSQDSNSTLTILQPPANFGGSYTVVGTTTAANTAGMNTPTQLWIDGATNIWVGNNAKETSGSYALSELTSSLAAVSPSGANGGFQTNLINAARTTVVDPVGNVWTVDDNSPNMVTVFLGAAVPIYAPYSEGIVNGRFQTIP